MKITEPKFWWNNKPSILIRLMSLPFGLLLKTLIFLRNKLFKKIFLPKPVICVGNFVVGGQGKTPFVRYLRSFLEDFDRKTVVISNGYGGKMKSSKIISEIDNSIDCGDEALLHAKDGLTVVSKNRVDALEVLDKSHFDFILLVCILLLGCISFATMYSTDGGEILFHTKSHFLKFVIFMFLMLAVSFFNIKFWFSIGYLTYLITIF